MDLSYLLASPAVWTVAMFEFILLNRGYGLRGLLQAAGVYAVASAAAMLPMAVAGHAPEETALLFAASVCVLYQLPYPLLYFIDTGARAGKFCHISDAATAMCMFGVLTALLLLGGPCAWVAGPAELAMAAAAIVQITYYALYRSAMDAYGFRLMTQTNTNEIIEFIRYYPLWISGLLVAALAAVLAAVVRVNLPAAPVPAAGQALPTAAAAALCMFLMLAGGKASLLARSGFASFFLAKRDNTRRLQAYPDHRTERERGIDARLLGKPYGGPSTIVLVIGESANRDYLTAFNPQLDRDTTPWLTAGSRDDSRHWTLFPNAYSCGMHTFMALEQGLTEKNQFNDKEFTTAASIVDMARATGRRIHWYSNQGHLGASLSQVSVIAEEADEALWTAQSPGLPPYDTELLGFLDRVDPEADNLVVLHLKGNHFSFENRYPAGEAVWQPDGPDDARTTYMNSVHYVDRLLQEIWQDCSGRLNLKAMVYCSDHAIIPDRHRTPTFSGFGDVRIPLAVWTSDDFIDAHPERYEALKANRLRYWTNDFLYELICGLMDVESPRFNPANSLAHRSYAHTRGQLTVLDGRIALSDDRQ